MSKKSEPDIGTNDQKRIYGVLSQIIYCEFINQGICIESIFTGLVYLSMGVLKEYFVSESIPPYCIYNNLAIGGARNDSFHNGFDIDLAALLEDNNDHLLSIYDEIMGCDSSSDGDIWCLEWLEMCRFIFLKFGYEANICRFLLESVRESLNVSQKEMLVCIKLINSVLHRRNEAMN